MSLLSGCSLLLSGVWASIVIFLALRLDRSRQTPRKRPATDRQQRGINRKQPSPENKQTQHQDVCAAGPRASIDLLQMLLLLLPFEASQHSEHPTVGKCEIFTFIGVQWCEGLVEIKSTPSNSSQRKLVERERESTYR